MKNFVFNSWVFATIVFIIVVIIRIISPEVFWDIIQAGLEFTKIIKDFFI